MKNKLNILNEIRNETLKREGLYDYLKNNSDPSSYPFVNVMSDKWRIAIPIVDEKRKKIDEQMLYYFKEIKEKLGFDINLETLIGTKKGTYTNNKGTFDKEQRVGVGKLMAKLSSGAAEFWQKENGYYTSPNNYGYFAKNEKPLTDYVMIVSRHPIDILRMSDHKNMDSCHSQYGSYFECAVDESKSGSIIAYCITAEDFSIIGNNLQDNEVFFDDEREESILLFNIVRPLLRVRSRFIAIKVTDPEDNKKKYLKFLIPEQRIYGDANQSTTIKEEFLLSFNNFLYDKQIELINKIKNLDYDDIKIFYTGGYYKDNYIIKLFNDFIQKNIISKEEIYIRNPKNFDKEIEDDIVFSKKELFEFINKNLNEYKNNYDNYFKNSEISISPENNEEELFSFKDEDENDDLLFLKCIIIIKNVSIYDRKINKSFANSIINKAKDLFEDVVITFDIQDDYIKCMNISFVNVFRINNNFEQIKELKIIKEIYEKILYKFESIFKDFLFYDDKISNVKYMIYNSFLKDNKIIFDLSFAYRIKDDKIVIYRYFAYDLILPKLRVFVYENFDDVYSKKVLKICKEFIVNILYNNKNYFYDTFSNFLIKKLFYYFINNLKKNNTIPRNILEKISIDTNNNEKVFINKKQIIFPQDLYVRLNKTEIEMYFSIIKDLVNQNDNFFMDCYVGNKENIQEIYSIFEEFLKLSPKFASININNTKIKIKNIDDLIAASIDYASKEIFNNSNDIMSSQTNDKS